MPARWKSIFAYVPLACAMLFASIFLADCARVREKLGLPCAPYDFGPGLPKGLSPPHPPQVCLTPKRVELGRRLFYDKSLSGNRTQACADCHVQRLAFTDGFAHSRGSTGEEHPRNAQGLANVGTFSSLTWFNAELKRLDNQALIPLFSESTPTTIRELAISGMEHTIADRLRGDPVYAKLFPAAFPNGEITVTYIARALAAFQATLVSYRSPFDRGVMNASARAGYKLFKSKKAGCASCHAGLEFNRDAEGKIIFANIGLYNVGGKGDYPDQALHGRAAPRRTQGLFLITGKKKDRGRFRVPSLRNVALTGPYMHDGSIASLEGVVDMFNRGGRHVRRGPLAGDGRKNPNKDARIRPLGLTSVEKNNLIAFMRALTDDCFTSDPRHSDPNKAPPKSAGHCRSAD